MTEAPLERAWREERTGLVATLAARLGDLELAEDAVQEAFAAAVQRWPIDGVPTRPGAWLMTAAWRRALDVRRRTRPHVAMDDAPEASFASAAPEIPEPLLLPVRDDVLRLMLTCCHPSLAPETRVALTLRHVAGLSAREIAAALLQQEAAVEKRLVRARAKLRDARVSFTLPSPDELPSRLADVHAVIYLVFTEGHLASGPRSVIRDTLCEDALWLARELADLAPHDAETLGLLALLRVQHARHRARLDDAGALVPFAEQDRSQWEPTAIDEARALLARAHGARPGPYQLEALIALLHALAPTAEQVPWGRIAELYDLRYAIDQSPVVAVNRAVAIGRAQGAEAGLTSLRAALDDPRMARYAMLHVAHADLLEQQGAREEAKAAWLRAASLSDNPGTRREIERRRRALE